MLYLGTNKDVLPSTTAVVDSASNTQDKQSLITTELTIKQNQDHDSANSYQTNNTNDINSKILDKNVGSEAGSQIINSHESADSGNNDNRNVNNAELPITSTTTSQIHADLDALANVAVSTQVVRIKRC